MPQQYLLSISPWDRCSANAPVKLLLPKSIILIMVKFDQIDGNVPARQFKRSVAQKHTPGFTICANLTAYTDPAYR